jgi:hypothetical protein
MEAENKLTLPKPVRDGGSYRIGTSSRFRPSSIELQPVKLLPRLPIEGEDIPAPLPTRPISHLSPALEILEGRWPGNSVGNEPNSRWSRLTKRFSTLPKSSGQPEDQRRESRWSGWSYHSSRPLTFRDSVWLSSPENLVLQFQFADEDEGEFFDPPHHIFDRAKKKRLVYLVSLAAVFSPLSSNIYFPALNAIASVCMISMLVENL